METKRAKNYEILVKKIENSLIKKDRYKIPIEDGLTVELDIFHDNLEGLIFAEVESPSVSAAENFNKPDWLGKDISFDKRFDNTALSRIDCYTDELDLNKYKK